MMPYLINWVKSESMPYQTITPNLPHFPSAGQPENMRQRARGTGKGGEDVSMSKNLQEPLEQKKISLLPGYLVSLAPGKN
jgi:hypothetical protein